MGVSGHVVSPAHVRTGEKRESKTVSSQARKKHPRDEVELVGLHFFLSQRQEGDAHYCYLTSSRQIKYYNRQTTCRFNFGKYLILET